MKATNRVIFNAVFQQSETCALSTQVFLLLTLPDRKIKA